jgi:hypothetical protein
MRQQQHPIDGKLDTLGLPFHGPVTGGTLTLPNSDTKTAPQPYDGAVMVARHPAAPGITRDAEQQAFDTANGYEWRDYAVLVGRNNQIGPSELGANHWIYADPGGGSWIIKAEMTMLNNDDDVQLTVTLTKLFGRFSPGGSYPSINRVLATQVFNWDTDLGGADTFLMATGPSPVLGAEPNEDGSRCFFNLYSPNGLVGFDVAEYSGVGLEAVIEIDINGNGSLIPATLGDGITASLSAFKTATDCYSTTGTGWVETGDYLASMPDTIDNDGVRPYFDRYATGTRQSTDTDTTLMRCYPIGASGDDYLKLVSVVDSLYTTLLNTAGDLTFDTGMASRVHDYTVSDTISTKSATLEALYHSENTILWDYVPNGDASQGLRVFNSDTTNITGESSTNVLLRDRAHADLPTATKLTNVLHRSGAKYTSAAFNNVSYHPEELQWNTHATQSVAWY